MCHNSNECANGIDILIPPCFASNLEKNWDALQKYYNFPQAVWISNENRGTLLISVNTRINVEVSIYVDRISNFDYGKPDNVFPFRVLSFEKLIEYYFCMMDLKFLDKRKIYDYVGGIEHLIKRKKLSGQFAEKLSPRFRNLFYQLIIWSTAEEKREEESNDESDSDMEDFLNLVPHIQIHGCEWRELKDTLMVH